MAINLKFDLTGNPEPPSIVLANRNGNKLGQLNVNVESIDVSDKFNAASEFSFTLNKYIDGEPTPLWDKVVDFKLVYCPEWDLWFEIKVELDETTETVKTVFCTQLGQAELSQIKVYNIHINEEGDPNWDTNNETYKSTILYDPKNTDASLLHRLLKDKAPHYSIAYVDESIQRIQKTFSFDDTSICDAFEEVSEEVSCLFVYNSNSTKGGKPNRTISVYDLQQNCKDCGHRGEFTDKCPKCGGTNIKYGYGEDTTIFVTSDELATEGIQLVTDTDSVKNCFKLEGGDDLMTATIRNCNPNGSDYIWYFSDALKEDMSKELVEKLESYDDKYQDYYKNHISELNETSVNQYSALVTKYKEYYDTKSTCLNCGHEDYFQEQCPKCNSKNILAGQKLQTIPTEIKGYPDLMTAYYNTIDLLLYLESGLMPKPDIESNKTDAKKQVELLTTATLSPVAVNVKEVKNISEATAKSAVLSMAKVLVKSTYKVDVVGNSSSLGETVYTDDTIGKYKKWTGKFVVTNYSNEEDSATSEIIEVFVGNDAKTFVKQKIDKALNKENTDDYSVAGLFAKEYDDFCSEIKKYALNPLDNFSKVCDAVISILQEQGIGTDGSNEDDELEKEKKKALYDELYKPYFDKQQAINDEIKIRENEIAIIEGVWDKSDESNPKCTTNGLQQYIEKCQQDIQEALNFEKHLGEDLWLEFCAYRREDKYSNSNYVSDGLNNAELFERALEFIEVAEEEIFKSAELQHSISATLNNLLSLPKFKPLLKFFKTGNWIRVQVDGKVYKLRLLEYDFGYGDSENIPVEFSDIIKIKNGVTDVKEVLEQASSMASSYDSVQRQAEKGNVARSTIDQWIVDGLDSADVQIKNNDSEEIILTKSGLLARSYDDIARTYAPEQFKLTHNIMAYTDDNWETVSSALGKHSYNRWNGSSFIDDEGYGLTSKFVTAGYITGSQIIGGEIVSSNYQIGKSGTYLNLIKGDFDFAGGKIVYNADKNRVTLSGVEIQWDSVNQPTIENIDGLSGITEDIRIIEQGLSATTINGQYVISPNIIGGYLDIKNSRNNTGVVIDPNGLVNDDYIFRVYNGDTTAIGLGVDGNAEFSGTINGSHFIGGDLIIGDKDKVKDYAEIDNNGKLTCTNVDIKGGVLTIGSDDNEETHTWISTDGTLNTYNANISGTLTSPTIIGGTINGSTLNVGKILDEEGNHTGDYYTTITDDGYLKSVEGEFENCTITGGSLKMGNSEDGYSSWISVDDGVLNANGVNISGIINAVEGNVAGWKITTDALYKNISGISSGMCSMQTKVVFSEGLLYTLNPDENSYTVSGIGSCTDTNVAIPNIYNGKPVISISRAAFSNCSSFTSVEIPDSVMTIGKNSFYGCEGLTSIIIPDCVTSIGESAFGFCSNLTSVVIGNGVTSIEKGTFSYCEGLISIIIPDSVTTIGENAFYHCDKLTSVYYAGSENDWNEIVIGSYNSVLENATRYYNSYYNCVSLVNSGSISPPRFFAGSVSNIPTCVDDAKFLVLEDGSLYASAVDIKGRIRAVEGSIGGLKILDGLSYDDKFALNAEGLFLKTQDFKLKTPNLSLYYNQENDTSIMEAESCFAINGLLDGKVISSIQLLTGDGNASTISNINLKTKTTFVDYYHYVTFQITTIDAPYTPISIDIEYQKGQKPWFEVDWDDTIYYATLSIKGGSTTSSVVKTLASNANSGYIRYRIKGATSWLVSEQPVNEIGEITHENITSVTTTHPNNNILLKGNLTPDGSNYSIGEDGNPYENLFVTNINGEKLAVTTTYSGSSTIETSDENKKNSILPLTNKYSLLFDKLNPISFKFNDGESGRTHIGLRAQDVKTSLDELNIDTIDFAPYCEWKDGNGNMTCGIRYSELVSLNIYEIQKLKKRVEELEIKLEALNKQY